MTIQHSPYSLIKKNKVNAKDISLVREGTLLKISQGPCWGVSDLTTWPTLGDPTWSQELKSGGLLYQRAVELAMEDLSARKEKRSLLKNLYIANNYLITDYKIQDPRAQPFGAILKIKGDRDIQSLAQFIHALPKPVKLRLDFNSCLSAEQFEIFLGKILMVVNKIDYIEDPTPYNAELWGAWNQLIPLAWDFQKVTPSPDSYSVRIVKPTREAIPSQGHFTLTSDMGHPVGLAHGLRLAQDFAQNESGFLTLDLFEETKDD